jgi:hypothetical protein
MKSPCGVTTFVIADNSRLEEVNFDALRTDFGRIIGRKEKDSSGWATKVIHGSRDFGDRPGVVGADDAHRVPGRSLARRPANMAEITSPSFFTTFGRNGVKPSKNDRSTADPNEFNLDCGAVCLPAL